MGTAKATPDQRVEAFAKKQGFPHIWAWLKANPGVPLVNVAYFIGDIAPIFLKQVVIEVCLAELAMPAFVCDVLAREIKEHLPQGWAAGTDFDRVSATMPFGLPQPYEGLAKAIGDDLRKRHPPPADWIPKSGEDQLLVDACARALESSSPEDRKAIEAGEVIPDPDEPGDLASRAVSALDQPVNLYDTEDVFLADFGRVPIALGNALAVQSCEGQVCNGGFHQFFSNPTGILAPEAAAGFAAIGMPQTSALVNEAMAFFGSPYPRNRTARSQALAGQPGKTREEWDPFFKLDDRFYELLRSEAGGVGAALDRHVSASVATTKPKRRGD